MSSIVLMSFFFLVFLQLFYLFYSFISQSFSLVRHKRPTLLERLLSLHWLRTKTELHVFNALKVKWTIKKEYTEIYSSLSLNHLHHRQQQHRRHSLLHVWHHRRDTNTKTHKQNDETNHTVPCFCFQFLLLVVTCVCFHTKDEASLWTGLFAAGVRGRQTDASVLVPVEGKKKKNTREARRWLMTFNLCIDESGELWWTWPGSGSTWRWRCWKVTELMRSKVTGCSLTSNRTTLTTVSRYSIKI